MTLLVLPIALALGLAGWLAIVAGLGWWAAGALAALGLLAFAAVAYGGGWAAFVRCLDRWTR